MLGVGFSYGGCMLTAIAGSMPQEEHGLCGLVSISGLFDMAAMMRHIAEQYAYPYGFANTRVSGGGSAVFFYVGVACAVFWSALASACTPHRVCYFAHDIVPLRWDKSSPRALLCILRALSRREQPANARWCVHGSQNCRS